MPQGEFIATVVILFAFVLSGLVTTVLSMMLANDVNKSDMFKNTTLGFSGGTMLFGAVGGVLLTVGLMQGWFKSSE